MTTLDQPMVSVIIPAYNAVWCIVEALDSVRQQTYEDYEVIVVNDGSTDNTKEVVEAYFAQYPLLKAQARLINQTNKRLGGARNTGIWASKSELVAFLDADDVWYPEKLKRVMEVFGSSREKIGLVCHDERVVKNGQTVRINHYGPWEPHMYERLLFNDNCLSPSAVVVRKDLLDKVGGFSENPRFHSIEDYDLWLKLSRLTRFVFLHEVLGEYRLFEDSLGSAIKYNLENTLSVLECHFSEYFRKRKISVVDKIHIQRRKSLVYRRAVRQSQKRGQFGNAFQYLLESLKLYPFRWKSFILLIFILFRIHK